MLHTKSRDKINQKILCGSKKSKVTSKSFLKNGEQFEFSFKYVKKIKKKGFIV
jgi:hypothetical protein